MEVLVISACVNFLDTKIVVQVKFLITTFVYGDPEQSKMKKVWDALN